MMKKILLMLLIPGLVLGVRPTQQEKIYFDTLDQQIVIAEQKAGYLLGKMQKNGVFEQEFEQASRMVEVKKSLVKHFRTSQALENSLVKWMLLEVLKKDVITVEDLNNLQTLVNETLGR